MKPLRVGTDCSGLEAPLIALEYLRIPYIHQFSCDNDKYIKQTISHHFEPARFYDDILLRDNDHLPSIDFYICGFPCQSFSTAGGREGFDKANNEGIIFFCCLDVIMNKKPKFFILENVKGLVRHEKGKTLEIILKCLNNLNEYRIYHQVLNTSDYDIPQKRDRVFFIGIRRDIQKREFHFPHSKKPHLKLEELLLDHTRHRKPLLSPVKEELVQAKIKHLDIDRRDNWVINLNASFPYATTIFDMAPCLVTTCNMFYLTRYNRFLTERECLRLQGFPDDYDQISTPNKNYKQIGNSMSINVLCYLLIEIYRSII
jgi:DNA (cytosine-5)-methyltransferase 1